MEAREALMLKWVFFKPSSFPPSSFRIKEKREVIIWQLFGRGFEEGVSYRHERGRERQKKGMF